MSVTEKCAVWISRLMVKADVVGEDDREVVAFGLFHILADGQQLIILVLIAALLGWLPGMMAFVLFYGLLRRYCGAFHARTHGGLCWLISSWPVRGRGWV